MKIILLLFLLTLGCNRSLPELESEPYQAQPDPRQSQSEFQLSKGTLELSFVRSEDEILTSLTEKIKKQEGFLLTDDEEDGGSSTMTAVIGASAAAGVLGAIGIAFGAKAGVSSPGKKFEAPISKPKPQTDLRAKKILTELPKTKVSSLTPESKKALGLRQEKQGTYRDILEPIIKKTEDGQEVFVELTEDMTRLLDEVLTAQVRNKLGLETRTITVSGKTYATVFKKKGKTFSYKHGNDADSIDISMVELKGKSVADDLEVMKQNLHLQEYGFVVKDTDLAHKQEIEAFKNSNSQDIVMKAYDIEGNQKVYIFQEKNSVFTKQAALSLKKTGSKATPSFKPEKTYKIAMKLQEMLNNRSKQAETMKKLESDIDQALGKRGLPSKDREVLSQLKKETEKLKRTLESETRAFAEAQVDLPQAPKKPRKPVKGVDGETPEYMKKMEEYKESKEKYEVELVQHEVELKKAQPSIIARLQKAQETYLSLELFQAYGSFSKLFKKISHDSKLYTRLQKYGVEERDLIVPIQASTQAGLYVKELAEKLEPSSWTEQASRVAKSLIYMVQATMKQG